MLNWLLGWKIRLADACGTLKDRRNGGESPEGCEELSNDATLVRS